MNQICETCDTKNRLRLCSGRDGDFKYCFRKAGSLYGLEQTITPFNTIDELYDKCNWLHWVIKDSLFLDEDDYDQDGHMTLLMGQYEDGKYGLSGIQPFGFVTK